MISLDLEIEFEIDLEILDIKENGEKMEELRNVIAWFEERHKSSKEIIGALNELKSKAKLVELQIGNWM